MNHARLPASDDIVADINPEGRSAVVLVCEHASCFIPDEFDGLGLSENAKQSHAAWDIGALAVATGLSNRLNARLVAAKVSRLVYDCNRPPSAPDAMPEQSELIAVPGNKNLTQAQRMARAARFYTPFHDSLAAALAARPNPVLVTIHSFTPIYFGKKRLVEIGILHDNDSRLADAMLASAPAHTGANVQRNAPYGPEHGVTHTLKAHAINAGHANVMIEISSALIETPEQQDSMASTLFAWLSASLASLATTESAK
jgi:predicted N-formylglutamate amidohydrolase